MQRALLQLHLAVLLWGFTAIFGVAIHLPAPVLVWYRMGLTTLLLAVPLLLRRSLLRMEWRDFRLLALAGILSAIHWVAFYGAIKASTASIALVCLSTSGIFTSTLDPFVNGGRRSVAEIGLSLLALAGVACIYGFEHFYGTGIMLGVFAAMIGAAVPILNKGLADRYPARAMVFWQMGSGWLFLSLLYAGYLLAAPHPPLQFATAIPGAIPALPEQIDPATLLRDFPRSLAAPNDWLWLILLSLVCTVWAQSLALIALRKLSAFTVTLSVNLEPVYGMILAFLLFREDKLLSGGFYLGVALIMLSVALQMVRLLRGDREAAAFVREKGAVEA